MDSGPTYDAILIVSFGGPEKPEDVIPFLENVLRGRRVPRDRLLEVAGHYQRFGGVSPINAQTRELIAGLEAELRAHGLNLPVWWGNRNWHPLLPDTLAQMAAAGVRRALAFVTSAWSSYSSCRQYLENIDNARGAVGAGAPAIDKLRPFSDHPGFREAMADRVRAALVGRRDDAAVLYTAHSIPLSMASGCRYESELREAAAGVSSLAGVEQWQLVYQSRSGAPDQPWLGPDIGEALRALAAAPNTRDVARDVVVVPLGFLSDHMEVLYDLDVEARALCGQLGLRMVRAGTVGTHPRFLSMIRERIEDAIARGGAEPCDLDCCRVGRGANWLPGDPTRAR